jgi:hypothetical protein
VSRTTNVIWMPASTTVCRSQYGKHVGEILTLVWASRCPSLLLSSGVCVRREQMQVVYEHCAGLDVHKRTVVACATTPNADGQPQKDRQTFSTMTVEICQMRDWLKSLGVTHVAM